MRKNFTVVDTPASLKRLAADLKRETVIACDLEADSMYHYQEKVCLLQIATENLTAVVDPLAVQNIAPLKQLFQNPKIRKIFHGADYDVRSMYRDFRIEINNLFDTELACRFLGMRSTGLEPVLKKMFGVKLDKKFQKRDWSQRPLPDNMLRYAAGDTIYLVDLSKILIQKLEEKGRLTWVTEECDILSRVRPAPADNGPLYLRFKGAGRLSRRNLALLEGLLDFRKHLAQKRDKPLFKIIGNEALMKIVAASPLNLDDLKAANALSRRQINVIGKKIIRIVHSAMDIPPKNLPSYPKQRAPATDPAVPKRIQVLKNERDARAKTLKMNPAQLFSKSLMVTIAAAKPQRPGQLDQIPEMREWQKSEFGEKIISLLKSCP